MEPLLVGVTLFSLALAATMTVVAWNLLRHAREREAARADALEALAFEDDPADRAPAPRDWSVDVLHRNVAVTRDVARDVEHVAPTFAAEPTSGTAGRRTLALAAVGLVMIAAVVTLSALRSPEITAAVAASKPSDAPAMPLELLSLRQTVDSDGTFTVTGLVENPANGRAAGHISAVVYLFDNKGRYFAEGQAGLDSRAFGPGVESPFVVKIANAPGVARYRVGFRTDDGAVVAHVDHRGQLPEGTTGDAVGAIESILPASAVRTAGDAHEGN